MFENRAPHMSEKGKGECSATTIIAKDVVGELSSFAVLVLSLPHAIPFRLYCLRNRLLSSPYLAYRPETLTIPYAQGIITQIARTQHITLPPPLHIRTTLYIRPQKWLDTEDDCVLIRLYLHPRNVRPCGYAGCPSLHLQHLLYLHPYHIILSKF